MILVTGATGFIGEQLVRALLERGEKVRILVRSEERATAVFGPLLGQLELAVGDLGDAESLQAAVNGISQVYHLASWISFQASLAKMREVNVEGLRRLLRACQKGGVKRVLHMSSIAAGGPAVATADGQLRPRTETDPPAPLDDPYGRTKLEQEQVALEYQERGLEVVIVRPSAVFGPGDPQGVNTLIWLVRQRRLPFYLGSSQGAVNLVFVRDVIRGTIAAMERGRPGEIYNLVGANLTQEQLMGLMAQVSGGRAPGWAMPVPVLLGAASLVALGSRLALRPRALVHPNDVRSWTAPWIVSDEKARAELGLTPTDLAAALRETLVWLSERKATRSAVATGRVE
ncbi:MAG: SDR family NAD(P)-dependent oxidoreductase [Bacillota bacterium]